MIATALFMVSPKVRQNENHLAIACVFIIITTYIDKGLGLVSAGFIPNPLEHITEYWPTGLEAMITLGIWATGFFILTVLYKIAVSIKEEIRA